MKPLTSKAEKVLWLLEHQSLWEGYPSEQVTDRIVFQHMLVAGLYGRGTPSYQAGIARLISAARRMRRMAQVSPNANNPKADL